MAKFFTGLCFVIFVCTFQHLQAQIVVRNLDNGKTKEIPFGSTIFYKLYSDSVLGIDLTPDYGVLTTSSDSNLVFADGTEIAVSDIKYLEVDNSSRRKWQGWLSPILISGMGFLSKGIVMGTAEGIESKNAEYVPFYLGVGGTATFLASIPFWGSNKKYDFTKGKIELITP